MTSGLVGDAGRDWFVVLATGLAAGVGSSRRAQLPAYSVVTHVVYRRRTALGFGAGCM